MKSRHPSFVANAAAVIALATLTSCLHFHHKKEEPIATHTQAAPLKTNVDGLAVDLKISPDPVKLGEVRQIDVTLILKNTSKKAVHLNFTSGQTMELQIVEGNGNGGKVVAKWSTDRTFNTEPRYLLVNSQERLEFNEPITTRDLAPGKQYTVEGFFIGHEKDLRVAKGFVPQP